MKKFAAVIVATTFLAGCSFIPQTTPQEYTPVTAQEKLDSDVVVQAVNLREIALCGTITEEAQRSFCELSVADQLKVDSAVLSADLEACKEVTADTTRERCDILVGKELEEQHRAERVESEYNMAGAALAEGDISSCEGIEDVNIKGQCETNIYLDLAAKEQNAEYCKNIEGELKELCEDQIN